MTIRHQLKVVVGLGKTGLSCVRHLVAKGSTVAVTDSRAHPPGLEELTQHYPEVPVLLGRFDDVLLSKAAEIIVSPGVSLKEPCFVAPLAKQTPIIGDIELFARQVDQPVVAITGSNGKSTVTSLVGHFAKAAGMSVKVGGNLGMPALDLLGDDKTTLYVLELSSFQLETTSSLRCLSAVNLNVSPDHMDRYESLTEYAQAKLRIYRHCQKPVINLDDPLSHDKTHFESPPCGFTLDEPMGNEFGLRCVDGEIYLARGEQNLLATRNLLLKGKHQYANVLAALAVGEGIGLSLELMLPALTTFAGLPHRCQWVATSEGVTWYNDSKATNVGATLAAICGLGAEIKGKLILLAGGQGKQANFSDLYAAVESYVRSVIVYGEDKLLIAEALKGAVPIHVTEDLPNSVTLAKTLAKEGDAVLLAPACASYDMFQNFEHRGEVFMQIVRGLVN